MDAKLKIEGVEELNVYLDELKNLVHQMKELEKKINQAITNIDLNPA